jgi:5'-nucleotidase
MPYATTRRPLQLAASLLGLLWATTAATQSAGMLTDIEKRDQAATLVSWVSPEGGAGLAARVRLITFNDLHGRIEARQIVNGGPGEPGRPVGGAAIVKAWIDFLVSQAPKDSVIIAAGDQIGGSPPVSALLQDEPTFAFLAHLPLGKCPPLKPAPIPDRPQTTNCRMVATVGNHEFDEGTVELERMLYGGTHAKGPMLVKRYPATHVPFIVANVNRVANQSALLPRSVIIPVAGVRIGVVAAVTAETPSIVPAGVTADLQFLPEAAAINAEVKKLQAEGVHAIVVVLHEGMTQYSQPVQAVLDSPDVAGRLLGLLKGLDADVDVVVSGHTHKYTNALVRGSGKHPLLVTQAYMYGTALGEIDLLVNRQNGDVVAKRSRILTTWGDTGPGLKPSAKVQKEVDAAHAKVAAVVARVLAQSSNTITRASARSGESAMGNLVADAQRAAAGADIAFMNAGGLRADLDVGPVTWEDLFSIQPFGNNVMRLRMTGDQIRRVLEQQWNPDDPPGRIDSGRMLKTSGLRYRWDGRLPWGARILDLQLDDGRALEPTLTYTVAASDFIVNGGDFFTAFAEGTDKTVVGIDLDALIAWVQRSSAPVNAGVEGRITRLDP